MAVAAFKSSSRRGNQNHSNSTSATSARSSRQESRTKAPIRRSRSVSAFSRGSSDISTEFLNKRDNPLFCSVTPSSPPGNDDAQPPPSSLLLEASDFDRPTPSASNPNNKASGPRGRHVTRNVDAKGGSWSSSTGRSLSRSDAGRRTRSASQCPASRRLWSYSTSESETDALDSSDLRFVESNRKGGLFGSDSGMVDQVRDLRRWSSQHSSTESSLETQRCADAVSMVSSGYGSDVKTIKAVSEKMSVQGGPLVTSDVYETVRSEVRRAISEIQTDLESAIQRSNATAIAVTNIADIPPCLVNPDAEELVFEIRREYAQKLEETLSYMQSQERARNLRANLAVEEHCGQELDRILKEVLPYPKTPNVQKSHPTRKNSIERRRMSKRLAEDAKAYFDECVSLSTFDSSDFSSQDDPPVTSVGPHIPSDSYECLLQESASHRQLISRNYDVSQPCTVIDTAGSPESGCKSHFSFSQKSPETSGFADDIQQYIKMFEKNVLKSPNMRSGYHDIREYSYQSPTESLLVDRVILKNRIEAGGLLLCSGGSILWSKYCGIGI
ncbi:uncharacterized protein LOC107613540 isoform X3 [Arachis ipaensis]|uniref:uncharacterized protein LOC107613540 isoform X3 n=1 Tax=Arachis ipaensis TaxID=130454 RepID=UPI000A2B3515|nr:uncharacterized protein LOC107613540 isoform X3 [Arachis ipaensis]XP_029150966.1 uncharacterized protein LOC112770767 isoform X3 [Arachis hypogaea]